MKESNEINLTPTFGVATPQRKYWLLSFEHRRFASEQEAFEDLRRAVARVARRRKLRRGLDGAAGVAHGKAYDARQAQHTDVVFGVAQGHHFLGYQAEVCEQRSHAALFAGAARQHFEHAGNGLGQVGAVAELRGQQWPQGRHHGGRRKNDELVHGVIGRNAHPRPGSV